MTAEQNNTGFSDDNLIRSVKNGNTANFEIIINRYKNKIINFIYRMTGDYDESRNISQEVFFMVYRKIGKYKENNTFQSYLYTIAKNNTLNYLKKMKRISFFSTMSERDADFSDSEKNSPHENLFEEERNRIVINGLKELIINQRLALILKVYLGFSYKKIAEITGWSLPKIETLISRAKANLKNYVKLQENRGRNV